jgi:hypothetical protein
MIRTLSLILVLTGCNTDGSGGDSPDGDKPTSSTSDLVDPDCVDGEYTEALPTPAVDITADLTSYSPSNFKTFLHDVLGKRFPTGQYLLSGGYESDGVFSDNCIDFFIDDTSSGEAVIRQASTLVHECGHYFDIATGGWSDSGYHFTEDLLFVCSDGSTPDNGGGKTFSRSLINTDEFSELHPPCRSFSENNCDSYALIYLNGNPTDSKFDSGDQGYNMLHEETLQYIHSLASGYTFNDFYMGATSERDGILTFLWYTTRYLRMARLDYPQTYALLSEDSCWRELILSTWGRAWLYLDTTEDYSQLGIDDVFLEELVREPVLLEEIERLRVIEGCE